MRTFSTLVRFTISSARRTSASVGAPKDSPSFKAFSTASTICGWECPWIMGPQEQMRSV